MASPYQIAGVRASLADLMQKSDLQRQQSQRATSKQMSEMQETFEDELEALQAKARKRSKKNKLLGNVLNLVGLGLGPLGAGLTKGLSSAISLQDQKTGAKMLLDKGMQQKYGSNFLRRGMKDFTRMAEDAQVSSGDVLRAAFGSGLAGFAMSKALGGSKEDGGLFKKMFKKPEVAAPSSMGGATMGADTMLFDPSMRMGEITIQGQATPMKTLLESFKGLSSGDNMKGGLEGIQSAMMLPLLIQQILGE